MRRLERERENGVGKRKRRVGVLQIGFKRRVVQGDLVRRTLIAREGHPTLFLSHPHLREKTSMTRTAPAL